MTEEQARHWAKCIWADTELQIDDNATVSPAEDGQGAWVSAWVWIDDDTPHSTALLTS